MCCLDGGCDGCCRIFVGMRRKMVMRTDEKQQPLIRLLFDGFCQRFPVNIGFSLGRDKGCAETFSAGGRSSAGARGCGLSHLFEGAGRGLWPISQTRNARIQGGSADVPTGKAAVVPEIR